jgi:hypothetical protein
VIYHPLVKGGVLMEKILRKESQLFDLICNVVGLIADLVFVIGFGYEIWKNKKQPPDQG